MSTPDRQLAFSARFLRRSFALACAALLLLSSSASAGSMTVLQFGQINPADVVTATNSGGASTTLSTTGNVDGGGVSVPVEITNFLGVSVLIPAFETFVGVTSTAAAGTGGPITFQNFSGSIEITSGIGGTGINYMTMTFGTAASSPTLSGTTGGATANLTASTAAGNSLVLTSDFAALSPPSSMNIGLANVSPPFGITGTSTSSFTGQNTGTVSASATVVPEPGTLCLSSFAVVFGLLVYRKKR